MVNLSHMSKMVELSHIFTIIVLPNGKLDTIVSHFSHNQTTSKMFVFFYIY